MIKAETAPSAVSALIITRVGYVVVAAVLLGGSFVPGLAHNGIALGELGPRAGNALSLLLIVAQAAPVALARRWPAVVLAVVGVAFGVFQVVGFDATFASLGLLVAIYAAARGTAAPRALAGVGTLAYAALAIVLAARGSPERPVQFVTFFLVLAAVWLAGRWLRSRAAADEERGRLAADLAVAAERRRLAGELHDVVTHHVTAMVLQSDAAGLVLDADVDPRVPGALTAISETGRSALGDLRSLLHVLAATPDERRPAVVDPADLVATATSAGQPVTFAGADLSGLPDPVRLAVTRIVQESLTNAMKHAPGTPTVVTVERTPQALAVAVVNEPGPADTRSALGGSGRGLLGLRERVTLLGGTFAAGAEPDDGGFAVRASIPLQDGRP